MRRVVDVVIPTRDRPYLLSRALESVLGQSYPHLRCTVVAVGCGSATFEALGAFADSRLEVVRAPAMSASAARNLGAARGDGELVAFCDDDSAWYSDFLSVMVAEVSPPAVMGYCAQQCYLAGGSPERLRVVGRKVRSVPFNPVALLDRNYIDTSCALITRSAFAEANGFDESLDCLEDWDLFARVALKHPYGVRHVDEVLSRYWYYLPEVMQTQSNKGRTGLEVATDFAVGCQPAEAAAVAARLRDIALRSAL